MRLSHGVGRVFTNANQSCAGVDEKTFQVWPGFYFFSGSRFGNEARARTKGVRHFAQTPFVAEVPRSSSPWHVIGNKIDFQGNELHAAYAAEVVNSIGSTIEGSSFSGLLTRVEIGHIRMGSAGNGRIKSPGSGSLLSQRA